MAKNTPKKIDWIGVFVSPFLGFIFFFVWAFYSAWTKDKYIILETTNECV